MSVNIDLPPAIEQQLRDQFADLPATAKEAFLVELYRLGQLSHGALAECLGISRHETDGVLARHHVTEDLLTSAELAAQVEGLRNLLGR